MRTEYQRGPQCVFGHFGSLSPTRSLAPALEAIALLLQRDPSLREVLRLEVYGSALDPQAAQLVESLKLTGVVLPIGRLEFDPATGLFVMTATTLAARPCCGNQCRHCPWQH